MFYESLKNIWDGLTNNGLDAYTYSFGLGDRDRQKFYYFFWEGSKKSHKIKSDNTVLNSKFEWRVKKFSYAKIVTIFFTL